MYTRTQTGFHVLLFTVVTSITFASDNEFRKSKYFKVTLLMIFQMMIAWLVQHLSHILKVMSGF